MPSRAPVVAEKIRRIQDVVHTGSIERLGHIVHTTAVQISLEVELGRLKTLDKTVPGRAL
jgi:hypothetical protein